MSNNDIDSLTDALSSQNCTIANGRDLLSDPGLAQLRRYVPVLAVIAAPYAGLGGDQDPLNPLDRVAEWRLLLDTLAETTRQQTKASTPLALVRMVPPTAARLAEALQVGGADAFRVVHFVCHGERDMLYLEDDNGYEAYAVAEHIVGMFGPGQVRLVVMDGCFSRRIAELLTEQTSVEAVVGTRRKISPENARTFNARFYAAISTGQSIRQAYRAALAELEARPEGQADRYDLFIRDRLDDMTLPMPALELRAERPLISDGMPPLTGVPQPLGFVGQREPLAALAQDIPSSGHRLYAIYGEAGIGKSWLAAEYAGRFAWRFPDGVLWFQVTAQTTAREIIAVVATHLGLPPITPPDNVLALFHERRILVVLDQIEALVDQAELDAFIQRIEPPLDSRLLFTARKLSGPLGQIGGSRAYTLGLFPPKSARTLAMRLAVERGVDELDVDTIDDFLERTLGLPWLIVRGIELAESEGLTYALEDLSTFKPEMSDPLGLYLGRRLKLLSVEADSPLSLLVRLQQLADEVDPGLLTVLGGSRTGEHVELLLKYSLLRQEGAFYCLPPAVRAYIRQHFPLTPEQQDRVDEAVSLHLIHSWSDGAAWLNNTRAILRRQAHNSTTLHPTVVARLLVTAAPALRVAGLIEEFLDAAQAIRALLSEGRDLALLQIAIAETLSHLPDKQDEAGWLFQVTASLTTVDANTLAEARRAYARYLIGVGQVESAESVLSQAFQSLLANRSADVLLASGLAHDWANALVMLGRLKESLPRYEGALAGYAEVQRADLSVAAQSDLAAALAQMGDLDRAEDVLRRALITADQIGLHRWQGQVRRQLAGLHTAQAEHAHRTGHRAASYNEWADAEQHLNNAIAHWLALPGSGDLAALFHDLGRIQARQARLDDAVDNVERSLYLFEHTQSLADRGAALVTLGQIRMAQGDSVLAQAVLHQALDLAALLDDRTLAALAAGVLVKVHQIRARHARRADRSFRQNTRDQASFTRAALAGWGLDEYVAALDAVIHSLAGK